jgi:tRNA(Ile)-lysidine synthetase-like protein
MRDGRKGQRSFGTASFFEYENYVIRMVVPTKGEEGWPEMTLALGGEIKCTEKDEWLSARVVQVDDCLRNKIFAGEFDPTRTVFLALEMKPEPVFQVREWKNGDAYQPLGSPGTAKLQDLFTNKKISVKKRHKLPIVCLASGQLIWCPYFPPAHLFRIKPSTKRAVQLTYRV